MAVPAVTANGQRELLFKKITLTPFISLLFRGALGNHGAVAKLAANSIGARNSIAVRSQPGARSASPSLALGSVDVFVSIAGSGVTSNPTLRALVDMGRAVKL